MTKRLFLALVVLLSITTLGSYAQIIVEFRPGPIKEKIKSLKSHLNRMTLSYKQWQINYVEDKSNVYYLLSHLEFPVITKAVTTRLRYMFDNRIITHIEVEGVGETTPEDIEKGIFDVTLSPEQTTLFKTNIHVKTANDSIVVLEGIANRRVIVVEGGIDEFHDAVIKMWYARNGDHTIPEIQRIANFYRHLNSLAGDVPEGLWVYAPERLSEQLGKISGKEVEMANVFDTKARLQLETEKFDAQKWGPDIGYLYTAIEHQVIAQGDSTRIKFLFNRQRVRSIKVLGYGKASKEDIKKGEYVVTVAPKKTKLIECYINGGQRAHRRVIVIDPEKYDEVMKDWGRSGYNSRYLDKLAGGVPLF